MSVSRRRRSELRTSMQLQRAAQDLLCKCSGMWLLPVATGMTQNKARRWWSDVVVEAFGGMGG
jgi:hypothetical protein